MSNARREAYQTGLSGINTDAVTDIISYYSMNTVLGVRPRLLHLSNIRLPGVRYIPEQYATPLELPSQIFNFTKKLNITAIRKNVQPMQTYNR